MKRLDGDGDGMVSFLEFAEVLNPGGDSELAKEPPEFPMPSARDLKGAFKMADKDKSGFVDESEFMMLFEQVIAGKVRGMGGGIEYYRKPTQHMKWGDAEFHPGTITNVSPSCKEEQIQYSSGGKMVPHESAPAKILDYGFR
jgi:hypothetical protein